MVIVEDKLEEISDFLDNASTGFKLIGLLTKAFHSTFIENYCPWLVMNTNTIAGISSKQIFVSRTNNEVIDSLLRMFLDVNFAFSHKYTRTLRLRNNPFSNFLSL